VFLEKMEKWKNIFAKINKNVFYSQLSKKNID
jgi:hypothetical protein